ncbi:protein-disulfide reductase DsbD family protein [Pararhodospirillum oryzae]|uniref:Suppressor for copper-sensitivity B n=1 Tax=Pararhodospirillum oryzae TaxID=478448 RepID=A0A512H7X9_9PROT|nr:protein-disulfide reductase DsbD domain-containing protein [Pararhodospirillum oryzae]GEO81553.1 suppressor for copper-sensitivity B [Pararhodospirillum oryzae]
MASGCARAPKAVCAFLVFFAHWAGLAFAEVPEPGASAWVDKPQGRVRLVSAILGTGQAETLVLGLEVDQTPPWKIYWRSPGDAGYPPSIDWSGSGNLARAALRWPVPERFSIQGLETVGYKGPVLLPIEAVLERPGDPLLLQARVDYLTCAEICVPEQASFSLIVPPGPALPSPHAQALARALARVPGEGVSQGLGVREAGIEADGTVRVRVTADPPLRAPDLFLDSPGGLAFLRPEVRVHDGGHEATLRAKPVPGSGPAGQPLRALVVADGMRGVEAPVDTARVLPPALPDAGAGEGLPANASLLTMAGLAVLGGLILNLMPCVLPVLSLKILGLIGHGTRTPLATRLSFLATAGGIVTSFLALAGVAIALKSAGAVVGWGLQFQQPAFLAAMAALLTVFAANLWGLFHIPLPGFLARLGSVGQGARGMAGAFLTGAFATLLATPCSAPFLGTAVGFALSRGPLEIALIFLLLGLGMALPYLGVAAWPRLAAWLPRPGPWMGPLRAVLGVALAGTALWLLSILHVQAGLGAAGLVAGLLVMLLALMGVGARWPRARAGVALGAVAVIAAVVIVPLRTDALGPAPFAAKLEGPWRPWSPVAVTDLVKAGRVVLVDVTAEWCTTCRVNQITVLDRGAVADGLKGGAFDGLVADWTRPDPVIAAYLASFGRYGIPFNVVYGPRAPDGIVLPELLSEAAVMEALARAGAASVPTPVPTPVH